MRLHRRSHFTMFFAQDGNKEMCRDTVRGVLMDSVFVSGSNGPGWSPRRGHCVVFLGKTLYKP